jgi:hypothetical protein
MRGIGIGNILLCDGRNGRRGVPADVETRSPDLSRTLAARFDEIAEGVRGEIAAFAACPRG